MDPSLGGEFPNTDFLRTFRQLWTFLSKTFQKLRQQNLGKTTNLTLSQLFAKMAESVSSGRRQSRHLCQPAGCWGRRGLSFLLCPSWERHICCFARHWQKSQAVCTAVTAERSSTSSSCLSQASLDLYSSSSISSFSSFSSDGLASPRIFVLVAAKFSCAMELRSFVLVWVLLTLLSELHTHCKPAYTHRVQHPASKETQSLWQTFVT